MDVNNLTGDIKSGGTSPNNSRISLPIRSNFQQTGYKQDEYRVSIIGISTVEASMLECGTLFQLREDKHTVQRPMTSP